MSNYLRNLAAEWQAAAEIHYKQARTAFEDRDEEERIRHLEAANILVRCAMRLRRCSADREKK